MMDKIDWKQKLSSRKPWAAPAGIVTGLAMVFGLDEGAISSAADAVVSIHSFHGILHHRRGQSGCGGIKKAAYKKAVSSEGPH